MFVADRGKSYNYIFRFQLRTFLVSLILLMVNCSVFAREYESYEEYSMKRAMPVHLLIRDYVQTASRAHLRASLVGGCFCAYPANQHHTKALKRLKKIFDDCKYAYRRAFYKIVVHGETAIKDVRIKTLEGVAPFREEWYKNYRVFHEAKCEILECGTRFDRIFFFPGRGFKDVDDPEFKRCHGFCEHEEARKKAWANGYLYRVKILKALKTLELRIEKIKKERYLKLVALNKEYKQILDELDKVLADWKKKCESSKKKEASAKQENFSTDLSKFIAWARKTDNGDVVVDKAPTKETINSSAMHIYTKKKDIRKLFKDKEAFNSSVSKIFDEKYDRAKKQFKDWRPRAFYQTAHDKSWNDLATADTSMPTGAITEREAEKDLIQSSKQTAIFTLEDQNSDFESLKVGFKKAPGYSYSFDDFTKKNHYSYKETPYVFVPDDTKGELYLSITPKPRLSVQISIGDFPLKNLNPKSTSEQVTKVSFTAKPKLGLVEAGNHARAHVFSASLKRINILFVKVNDTKRGVDEHFDCFKRIGVSVNFSELNYLIKSKATRWTKSSLLKLKRNFINESILNLSNYDCVQFIVPGKFYDPEDRSYFLGLGERPGKYSWVSSGAGIRTSPHEIGHNLGLWHRNYDQDALMAQTGAAKDKTGISSDKLRYNEWEIVHDKLKGH